MTDTTLTGDTAFDQILAIVGALIPLLSAIASAANWYIRRTQVAGDTNSKALLFVASALNFIAVNLDKAHQLGRMARGLPVKTTTERPES